MKLYNISKMDHKGRIQINKEIRNVCGFKLKERLAYFVNEQEELVIIKSDNLEKTEKTYGSE